MLKYFVLFVCLVKLVLSDEIYIYSPPQNGIYHPTDVMDIRFNVRSMGMTRIWAATATLTHVATNNTIDEFPRMLWNASTNTTGNSTDPSSIHQSWTIPVDIPIGNYSLTVSGNTSYLCSKNGNGTAPFTHCKSVLYKHSYFIISNGTAIDS
ncbi:unnamed protein product [Mucor hiemalis]